MSQGPHTTRDQLTLLVDLVRRAIRHTWLVALISIVGAGLSVMLAMMQKPKFESEAVLLYQEKISSSVLRGQDSSGIGSRTMSARFKEMLLSRATMSAVVEEFDLYPDLVKEQGTIAAAESLRQLVSFTDRGAGTFRIAFLGETPEQAQQVTARLAASLQEKDESVRMEQAQQTKKFLMGESANAENALAEAESDFASFVAQHPEFVAADQVAGSGVGASIRAANKEIAKRPDAGSNLARLRAEAARLKERIANPTGPVAPALRAPRRIESPALRQARDDLSEANRNFEEKSNRFTAKHPDVIAAKNNVAEQTRKLKRLEASEEAKAPTATVATITPTTSVADLQKQLSRIDAEIRRLEVSKDDGTANKSKIADELVNVETEHARLQRRVQVASQRLSGLEARVFTAEITASSEFAEAAKLVIIDQAYLPARAAGRGRKVVALAGTMVFTFLGMAVALGLALIDDRVYRRADIDELGIAPVLVVIPKQKKRRSMLLRRG